MVCDLLTLVGNYVISPRPKTYFRILVNNNHLQPQKPWYCPTLRLRFAGRNRSIPIQRATYRQRALLLSIVTGLQNLYLSGYWKNFKVFLPFPTDSIYTTVTSMKHEESSDCVLCYPIGEYMLIFGYTTYLVI